MIDIIRQPDDIMVSTDNYSLTRDIKGVDIKILKQERELKLFVTAQEEKPRFVCLRWNYKTKEEVKVLGDKWERAYADLFWSSINPELFMPWYFFIRTEKETTGIGVEVGPNSFVSFEYDASGVTAWVDVRCGARGVELKGRELLACTFLCEGYEGVSSFEAAKRFCKLMSPNPKLPDHIVYGGNNWYYAYGKSSREEILAESEFLSNLAKGLKNRPYMVIDDGWSKNLTDGPWQPNEKFGDMKSLVKEMKEKGVKPGIWVRLLANSESSNKNPEWQLKRDCQNYTPALDPSHPQVKEYLRQVLKQIKNWGFELLKHDYSTCDLFEGFGMNLNGSITNEENWTFFDKSKTSAEITLEFYRLIREECEDMVIIGCDTVSHLSAGIFEINRIGDDTSSKSWSRTRALGVNSLAFRLPQNESFYMADADCVCVLGDNIPWEMNKQWLDLLAKSTTPLFISCNPKDTTDKMRVDIKKAFLEANLKHKMPEPIDWEYNKNPSRWIIENREVEFDWIKSNYPVLLKRKIPPIV